MDRRAKIFDAIAPRVRAGPYYQNRVSALVDRAY